MNKYTRYFKITAGPLIDAANEVRKTTAEAHIEYLKILKEIGAKDEYFVNDGRLVGLIFDENPDGNLYKRVSNGWMPKQNCKQGKELFDRIRSIKTASIDDCLKVVGLSSGLRLFYSNRGYAATSVYIPSDPIVVFVSVPWYDEDPEKLDEYVKERDSGLCGCSNMEAVLWEPTSDMIEVKEWEVRRAVDEWNESIKAKGDTNGS